MNLQDWLKIKGKLKLWREIILPGFTLVGLLIIMRLAGFFEVFELMVFDDSLRRRPPEAVDQRVVIVGIDEDDLKAVGGFPVPNKQLAEILKILHKHEPRVIGLDLFRDLQDSPERDLLSQTLQDIPNIIGVEVALNQGEDSNVQPPSELPSTRVGLADFVVDPDGKMRRGILAARPWQDEIKYSFALVLAKSYLESEGISFKHGNSSRDPISLGTTELPRFLSNWGGYVGADSNGNQILLNFRAHRKPCRVISLADILEEKFNPNWIGDRIVIIGMTAASVKDEYMTAAVKSSIFTESQEYWERYNSYKLIYGVEIHAHLTSQIVSVVLDGRPLLRVWSDFWEYIWILSWGLLGISLGIIFSPSWKSFLSIGIASLGLILICYLLLLLGWWIPVLPSLLALCSAGLTTSLVDLNLRLELEQRRLTIERTFEAVHNGPLQHLAVILRSTDENKLSAEQLRIQLQSLNRELRSIYESMRQELLNRDESFYLDDDLALDLESPIAELLYQVYDHTLDRDFPGFSTIVTYIPPNFASLEDSGLSSEQKRGLCLFLQEALCNVGKHGIGTTRLDVVCKKETDWYRLSIIDNGVGITSSAVVSSQGSKQAEELARQLRGRFQRKPKHPQGTICELGWPISISRSWRFKLRRISLN
ncbi:MAG: CHASE2 domain-containing protein [Coleofasciculaceae cyanobacterium]